MSTKGHTMSSLLIMVSTLLLVSMATSASANIDLPVGSHPTALEFPHFPDRLHAFVWRNWQLVDPKRMADVIETSEENVIATATSMGLPPAQEIPADYKTRAYITILRRNWHLLPYDQLLPLLDMTAEELAFSLDEDDFLFIKLGSLKPKCEPLRYIAPDQKTSQRAAEIKRLVQDTFGHQLTEPGEARFHFVDELSQPDPSLLRKAIDPARKMRGLRFIYSYFAPFGDPLMDGQSDPFPDGLLARLADVGVNGVWLHVVLRQLAAGGKDFPEFGEGHQQRLANLRRLAQRAERYGIGVYLYINEPRAMPQDFFKNRPEMAGITARGLHAMCTSDPRVRQWMSDSLSHVFREVSELAGVFTITASENVTNCSFSNGHADCPRCRDRSHAEIIAEVNSTIAAGVHAASPEARVICWDWGWNANGDGTDIIDLLPRSVWFMSVSEWATPISRGGVESSVGEYCLSVAGPGPRAKSHWAHARMRGIKTVAKMQINCTWEMAAVPNVPVMDIVAEHCANLARESVDGQMLSWSLGGYPSANLKIAERFAEQPDASAETVLNELAVEMYGEQSAPDVRTAWSRFSKAFGEYPFGGVIYNGPHLMGPANLLYDRPTGYGSTMVGIPYDAIDNWSPPYPPAVLGSQFRKVADGWMVGLDALKRAVMNTPEDRRTAAERDLGIANVCWLHFASVANQIEFVLARDGLATGDLSSEDQRRLHAKIERLLQDEILNARQLYALTRQDSRIGYEASNHYFYVPLDLVEKVINCDWILQTR